MIAAKNPSSGYQRDTRDAIRNRSYVVINRGLF